MTIEEFEHNYAKASNLTVELLRKLGLRPAPCDCGEEGCQGWQMLSKTQQKEKDNEKSSLKQS